MSRSALATLIFASVARFGGALLGRRLGRPGRSPEEAYVTKLAR